MSRITQAFASGRAFIPFITCGDPDLETTASAIRAMADAGADLIELGIPFSDPTAEGPALQAASMRALRTGTTTDRIFALVRELRKDTDVPMLFMTYANVVFSYGAERFITACAEIGVDGLLLPDVPFEEKEEFAPLCRTHGVDLISMAAPAPAERIRRIAEEAAGFLYVTGADDADTAAIVELVHQCRPGLPCAAGIAVPAADGIIAESAVVELIARYGGGATPYIREYVKKGKATGTFPEPLKG